MVCTHCLDELERALEERALPARLRRLPAVLTAIAVVVALVWGGSAAVGKLLGPAGSLASMECAAQGLAAGPAFHTGPPPPTAATAATPAAAVPPEPAALAIRGWTIGPTKLALQLHGAGFVPHALICVTGGLSGPGRGGQARRDTVGPFGMQAGTDGAFSGSVDFGSAPGGYAGGYTVDVGASAIAGSAGAQSSANVRAVVKGTTLVVSNVAGS